MTHKCDKCNAQSMFDGFGNHFCWKHYSEWILRVTQGNMTIEETFREKPCNSTQCVIPFPRL